MLRTWSLLISLTALIGFPALQAQTEQTDKAVAEAKTTAPAQPPEPLSPEKRGDIFMARKMYREAIEQYRQCPKSAIVLNKTGIGYHQLTELGTAEKYYKQSIKLNAKYSEAVNNLGTIYYARKSYRRAVGQYRKALNLSPDSASIYSNLGTAFFARKQYKEAAEAYQKALSIDPDVFDHQSSYGVLLQERNVEERAKFHYYLARTYAQAGMPDRALLCIRKALEEGFKERKKFLEEPEFAGLQKLPEFLELMQLEPRVL